jgi:hypothetical protein
MLKIMRLNDRSYMLSHTLLVKILWSY